MASMYVSFKINSADVWKINDIFLLKTPPKEITYIDFYKVDEEFWRLSYEINAEDSEDYAELVNQLTFGLSCDLDTPFLHREEHNAPPTSGAPAAPNRC